ncbi:MAG: squalene--hopene cyclase [Gemmataceae bacterium]|nr:squalene--hopene cyclase [Gemmataceae bacterium]
MHGSQTASRTSGPALPVQTPNNPVPSARLQIGIEHARRQLLHRQEADGHWVGELQGDTILESEYILLMAFLGRERDERVAKAARYILQQQMPDGAWSNYPGGPADLSVSVKAYFGLKLAGHDPQAPYMRRACEVIRSLGGAAGCNSFTKFYLALLGEFPYDNCAAVPPEMMLLPQWAYFHIHAMSSWTRTIVIPLSIFYAYKPVRHLSAEQGIRELFLQSPQTPLPPHPWTPNRLSWTNFFLVADRVYKWLDARGVVRRPRAAALQRAVDWMFAHFEDSDGIGAIYPPIIYTIICLRCLGYADDSPRMRWALKQLDDLMIEEDDTLRIQPCRSPVWDTALTLVGLADAGLSDQHTQVARGVQWLLNREVRQRGDWSVMQPKLAPGGWFFEYNNAFYPDTDDTAMVLMALARNRSEHQAPKSVPNALPLDCDAATKRGLHWLLAMQNKDGGWAAFDRDINRELLTKVPFADHNAMLDPSCPDITGRVLEALGHYGHTSKEPLVKHALAFLERTQEPSGAWLGRWGVNYIYGTWQVLVGLQRVGFDRKHSMVRRAVVWLRTVQQACGGWGESCESYDDPSVAGQGEPTASQTAWALLGLMAAGEGDSDAVKRGIDYLLSTQQPDGSWHEEPFTGTGFPKVFYLKYHMYPLYFPLMALARYARAIRNQGSGARSQESGASGQAVSESSTVLLHPDC